MSNGCGLNKNKQLVYNPVDSVEVIGDYDIIAKLQNVGNSKKYYLSLYKFPEIQFSSSVYNAEVGATIPSVIYTGKILPKSFPIATRTLSPEVPSLNPLTVDNFQFTINNLQSDLPGLQGEYTLSVTDDAGRSANQPAGVLFQYPYFQGYSTQDTLDEAGIKALQNRDLANSVFELYGGLQTYTIPATGFQHYIYWGVPVGTPAIQYIRIGLLTFPFQKVATVSIESDVKAGLFYDVDLYRSGAKYSAGSIELNMVLPDDVTIISAGDFEIDGGENGEPYT